MVALPLVPEAQETLILGHGGGSLAKWLAQYRPELHVDAVEVDPAVAAAAERHFDYRPPETHHVYVKDARAFLRSTTKMYDVIWMDCFARHLIPFHLTTHEFFQEVRAHLKPDGILAVNLSSGGERPDQLRAEAVVSTLKTVFPVFESYGVKGPWKTSNPEAQNFIFFAGRRAPSMTDPAFVQRVAQWMQERRLPPETLTLLASRRTADWPTGTVLTDDFAPFDLLIGH